MSFNAPPNEVGNPSGGLPFTYTVKVTDASGNTAFSATGIPNNSLTTDVNVAGLDTNADYNIQIYANNGVDNNFNIYYTSATTIPLPVEINDLSWNQSDSIQISLNWSYDVSGNNVMDFMLVYYDIIM